MKKLLTIFLIFVILSNLSAQKISTKKIPEDPFYFDNFILVKNGGKSFIISKYKTTNKEYLCFLHWTYKVYGVDYPEIYQRMLPDTMKYPDIFNPEKSNKPVMGISKKQAQFFCQWRSDRLNEYILIREGILKKDPNQMNEENFNTESYLCGQYEGMVKNDLLDKDTKEVRKVLHTDYILLPGFYVASKKEIQICDSLNKSKSIQSLKSIKSDLDWWMTNELEWSISDPFNSPLKLYTAKLPANMLSDINKIESFVEKYQKELANEPVSFDTTGVVVSDKDYRSFNLKKFKSEMRYYKQVSDSLPNPFVRPYDSNVEKDSIGKMPFIYITDNYDGTPVCIYRKAFQEATADKIPGTGFYCAMNIPFRIYRKLQEY
jgi:hypothetical protein